MKRQPLTGEQRRGADPGASAWVEASAGTGKTQVLTGRVLWLLLTGVEPAKILCLTFTKAAAAEMRARIDAHLALWATAPDATLSRRIADITGAEPTAAQMRAARRLFARVLDAPGGMRIQTIHAFCQAVLRRFPVEARLAPHFAVIDEAQEKFLMRESRDALLEAWRLGRAVPALGTALGRLTGTANEEDFGEILRDLTQARGRLRRALDAAGGIEKLAAAIRGRHGVEKIGTEDGLRAGFCADGAFDADGLRRAARALAEGGKKDNEKAARIGGWLALTQPGRAGGLGEYRRAFLTKDGKAFNTSATAKVEKDNPGTAETLARETDRVRRLDESLRALAAAERTIALARVGAALLAEYQRQKAAHALIDYDDMVLTTRALLEAPGVAPWVLYKLDGGIEHILIDEAQDTNPDQWHVVEHLAGEFFAGEGTQGPGRTVFAVGDPKQSIFSFQGADPTGFAGMRAHFEPQVKRAGGRFEPVALRTSFRSVAPVLKLVDEVFRQAPAREGVAPAGALEHKPHRVGAGGLVEIWPLAAAPEDAPLQPWAPPLAREEKAGDAVRLIADTIARTIRRWLDGKEPLAAAGRPIQPGDVMVLVRRRGNFVDALVRALKAQGIPVSGRDRMMLVEQLAVMDLMALGDVLLLPEDDLTLATVLKGPLFGFDEDRLFRLAHGRAGRLWEALRASAAGDKAGVEAAAYRRLQRWMNRADFVSPFRLYAEILGADGGRREFLERLGPDAADPIDEFLAQVAAHERTEAPSLQGFHQALRTGGAEIKRDLDRSERGEVRIMTVHGAKGLQAPIVFLPDTAQAPRARDVPFLLWTGDAKGGELPLLRAAAARDDDRLGAASRAEAERAQRDEYHRLLYVALTRAEDRLYVTGWRTKKALPDGCWYRLVHAGADQIATRMTFAPASATPKEWDGEGLHLGTQQEVAAEEQPVVADHAIAPLPGWACLPPPPEPEPPRPLAPSEALEDAAPVVSPLDAGTGRFRRGLLVHRLLQLLPELARERRAEACRAFLARRAHGLDAPTQAALAAEILAVLEQGELAALFGPSSRAEVPVAGVVGNRAVAGQIDRLVVSGESVLVVDYKTNRPPPSRIEDIPSPYLAQMAAYRAVIRGVYPGKRVRCALLWTDGPVLMALPDAALDRATPSSLAVPDS